LNFKKLLKALEDFLKISQAIGGLPGEKKKKTGRPNCGGLLASYAFKN
jgi:hypothetical protein